MKGIRRLFLPHVGMRGSVKHLFEEFQNSLGNERADWREHPRERWASRDTRLQEIVRGARERGEFLSKELESLRKLLCELLDEQNCTEWLGYNDLSRPDTLPPVRLLAGFIRELDWTNQENVHKLRLYRTAAFIEFLRPGAIDWETPHMPSMELVLKFIKGFTRPGISSEEQALLIDDLSRPRVPLEKIVQTERDQRLRLSLSDLRYVWETRALSHEQRAMAWDNRAPEPFQPFGRSNLEMHRDKKLTHRWRVAVNHQLSKARALYDSASGQDEGEAN